MAIIILLILGFIIFFGIIGKMYMKASNKDEEEKTIIEKDNNEKKVNIQVKEDKFKINLKDIEQKQDIQNNEILQYSENNKFNINGGELKKFKITNIEIEFYSDIQIYKELKDYFNKTKGNINNILKFYKGSVNTLVDGVKQIEEYNKYFYKYYKKIAEIVVKILIKYDIYDITVNDIMSKIIAIEEFNKVIKNGNEIQSNLQKEMDLLAQDILNKAQTVINTPSSNASMGIISNSPLQILAFGINEAINSTYKKFTSTDVRILQNLAQQTNNLVNQANQTAISNNEIILNSINAVTYKFINELFEYMINILLDNKKICPRVLEKLDTEKSNKIIGNIKNIDNEEKKKEQIINVLQLNPYSKDIHKEIIKYQEIDVDNYIEMLNFIGYKEIETLLPNKV